jgi:hypothetical protein
MLDFTGPLTMFTRFQHLVATSLGDKQRAMQPRPRNKSVLEPGAEGVNEDREVERGGSFEQEFHSSRHFAGYIFQRIAYGPT